MTHFCVAHWDGLANDVACGGGFYAHCGLLLLRQFTFRLYLCVDLLFLRDEIIRIFLCLEAV